MEFDMKQTFPVYASEQCFDPILRQQIGATGICADENLSEQQIVDRLMIALNRQNWLYVASAYVPWYDNIVRKVGALIVFEGKYECLRKQMLLGRQLLRFIDAELSQCDCGEDRGVKLEYWAEKVDLYPHKLRRNHIFMAIAFNSYVSQFFLNDSGKITE
jgi:hypothetical protein